MLGPALIYPNLDWYRKESDRKCLPGRCPYASVQRCPRSFESLSLLSEARITTSIAVDLREKTLAKWREHELWAATGKTSTSISGGKVLNCFSNFCPEVSDNTFRLFTITHIGLSDDPTDRQHAEQAIKTHPAPRERDWRWSWSHVESLHFSDCPLYAQPQPS